MPTAIVVAGGHGSRMKNKIRKQYLMLGNHPIVYHSLKQFINCHLISKIVLVIPKEDAKYCENNIIPDLTETKPIRIVHGGSRRQESVYNGLKALDRLESLIVIHDGVRPFVQIKDIEACIHEAAQTGACILGVPAEDTIKVVSGKMAIKKTLNRDTIWLAQTPQAFQTDLILSAHENARKKNIFGSDDAYLVEKVGGKVKILPGSKENIKITTPDDLLRAEIFLKQRVH